MQYKALPSTLALTMGLLLEGSLHASAAVYDQLAISPDGLKIAYSMWDGKNDILFVVNSDGSRRRQLTQQVLTEGYPAWSPDNQRILFSRVLKLSNNSPSALFVRRVDGNGERRISSRDNSDMTPNWSADGKWIAFTRLYKGKEAIAVAAADGTHSRIVTYNPSLKLYTPVWSPDDKRLVFSSEAGDRKDQIWTVNADGTGLKRRTDGKWHNYFPSWSPDGKHILYTSKRDTKPGYAGALYVMQADGSNARKIPATDGAFMASWCRGKDKIVFIHMTAPDESRSNIVLVDSNGGHPRVVVP